MAVTVKVAVVGIVTVALAGGTVMAATWSTVRVAAGLVTGAPMPLLTVTVYWLPFMAREVFGVV